MTYNNWEYGCNVFLGVLIAPNFRDWDGILNVRDNVAFYKNQWDMARVGVYV